MRRRSIVLCLAVLNVSLVSQRASFGQLPASYPTTVANPTQYPVTAQNYAAPPAGYPVATPASPYGAVPQATYAGLPQAAACSPTSYPVTAAPQSTYPTAGAQGTSNAGFNSAVPTINSSAVPTYAAPPDTRASQAAYPSTQGYAQPTSYVGAARASALPQSANSTEALGGLDDRKWLGRMARRCDIGPIPRLPR